MKNVELHDLYKKYPFMYKVENDLYVIGHGVFKKNTSEISSQYFNKYEAYISEVGRDNIQPYQLDEHNADTLVYLYRKVMAYAEISTDEYDKEFKKNLYEFIDKLSANSEKRLTEQLEDYIRCFWYYNRRFD